MDRSYYLDLAASGLRMPIGTDLVLHEKDNHKAILEDGDRLGAVIAETARRFGTPLAVSHMDLELEKAAMLAALGVARSDVDTFKYAERPDDTTVSLILERFDPHAYRRLHAHIESVGWVARNTDLLPVGMSIGPFSLTTKMLADPITPIYMAGSGVTADEDPELDTLERVQAMAQHVIQESLAAQIAVGARAVFIAEPAANRVFFSPRQLEKGSGIYDRYVIEPLKRIKEQLDAAGVDLILHDCGELTDEMVVKLASVRPVILSLGSSRTLWKDAALVTKDIVLYGNLPSKQFYSDELISLDEARARADELVQRMAETGHPFILGSECDILSVPGCERALMAKAEMLGNREPVATGV